MLEKVIGRRDHRLTLEGGQGIRGSSPTPPPPRPQNMSSAYGSHGGRCSKDKALREWRVIETTWSESMINPVKVSTETIQILVGGCGDLLIPTLECLRPPKTCLVSGLPCLLNLLPQTSLVTHNTTARRCFYKPAAYSSGVVCLFLFFFFFSFFSSFCLFAISWAAPVGTGRFPG